ncbi:hypothetical protein ODJ79_08360 [Actinoplanes sp. KI2]|uniref:hypothetical protein n=1 Tax=Actinoplanes sp. KI2 TaxID=2983315 RepID=UPI0021D5CF5F|nr:hypothetical protein [Actinoplanes sp. KI2]MCU7723722.1 hypothetical protein [Actinoplanes sp. KI2]
MEGHRYADDEPSWYAGQGQYARTTDPEISGIHERPSGAFRLPEQRPAAANPYALTDPLATSGSHAVPNETYDSGRIPVRGPEYPTIRPTTAEPMAPPVPAPAPVPEPALPLAGPTSLVPPVATRPESVYQSRRPVSSFLVAIVMVVLLIPVIRLLLVSTFTGDPSARGIVPAVLLTLGFTLTGVGLFTVARGGTISRETWLRPPVAYLPVGLILMVAAGLAVA